MTVEKAAEVVLGKGGPGTKLYIGQFAAYPPLLPTYRYHFLTLSKPATHLTALAHMLDLKKMPAGLKEVLQHISEKLRRD